MALTHEQRVANGKLGGRKNKAAELSAEAARTYIADHLPPHIPEIFNALLEKAKYGDIHATRELFDRGWGKAPQALDLTTKGEKFASSSEVKSLSEKFDVFFKQLND